MQTLSYTQARITGLILLSVAIAGVLLITLLPAPRQEEGSSVGMMTMGQHARKQMI